MTDYLITFAAVTSVGLWSVLMIAVGVIGQRARQRRRWRQEADRLVTLARNQAQTQARQQPRYPAPSAETIRKAQA